MRGSTSMRRDERWSLAALITFTAVAVGGYWNFALHPERIPRTSAAMSFFATSYRLFACAHIVLAGAVLAYVLTRRVGGRWLPALAVVYALSFLAEHVGTGYGFPFGPYAYSNLLGPKLDGRVPFLIPLSWFLMCVPIWVVVQRAQPGSRIRRIALGALCLTVWDLALDPAMSFLTRYWTWLAPGPYYGMPWTNLAGWYVVGLAIFGSLDAIGARVGLTAVDSRWAAAYSGIVLLMPLGMVAAAGLWPAVAATVAGMAVCGLFTHRSWRSGCDATDTTDRADHPALGPASTAVVVEVR